MNRRVQVNDNFGTEQLQTKARPGAVAVQAVGDPHTGSEWMSLANAFAKGELVTQQFKERKDEEDKLAAQKYANSMTIGELSKAIKSGSMLPSQSPVFAATVQHIWGDNTRQQEERDVLGRLQTGELKFNSAEEVDQYLTESRNTALSGQSKYAAAGYDKGHSTLRTRLMSAVTQQVNGEQVEQAQGQATESLMNGLSTITAPDYKGTPDEAAATLMERYQMLRKTAVLPEAATRGAMTELVTRMSAAGNTALLSAFMNQEMEGIGKVSTFLGEKTAQTLTAKSNAAADVVGRERVDKEALPFYMASDQGTLNTEKLMAWGQAPENARFVSSATIHSLINRNNAALAQQEIARQKALILGQSQASIAEAQRQTEAAISEGQFWRVNGQNKPKFINEHGDVKDFDVKGHAEQALEKATKDLPMDQQVSSWALNGITNPDWQHRMKAGFFNLSTIGVDAKGKPVGELNAEGKAAIDLFQQLNSVNPEYAKQVAGEEEYKRFGDIAFLQYMGKDISTAAGIANGAASGAITSADVGNMTKKVNALANDMLDNPWYKPEFLSRAFGDNVEHNTAQVAGVIRRYSSLLAMSGQYANADKALEEVGDYLSNPKVTTKINGTLYMRSELPQAPAKEDQDKWFERFIENAPKKVARDSGFAPDIVRLEFDPRIKGYRAMAAGVPLGAADGSGMLIYTKADIQQWYAIERQKDVRAALMASQDNQARKRHEAYSKRISDELWEMQGQNKYTLEQYDTSANHAFFSHNILGEQAFKRIEREGNADKHLRDLMQLYPNKRK